MPHNRGAVSRNHHTVESLESRQLLTVALETNGVLYVEGTRRYDAIQITASTSKGRPTIHVNLNHHDFVFRAAAVRKVQIVTGKGDDEIIDGEPSGASLPYLTSFRTTIPMSIFAGDGNDIITGSDANDTINGQSGNDVIYAFNGDDSITCGDGDDTVLGFGGADTINGGNGDDDLAGDLGYLDHMPLGYAPGVPIPTGERIDDNDRIIGGPGLDTFHNEDARPQQIDAGRQDRTVQDSIVY
jgi:Ca2+-binding RTX toxin-like protein